MQRSRGQENSVRPGPTLPKEKVMDFLDWNDTLKIAFLIMISGLMIATTTFVIFVCWLGAKRQAKKSSDELIQEAAKQMMDEEDAAKTKTK